VSSPSTSSPTDLRLPALFLLGVLARFLLGIGVPTDFLGLPRPLLGVLACCRLLPSSLSDSPLRGIVVVVVRSLRRDAGTELGEEDLLWFSSKSSASTVTRIFCGESSLPKSSWKVCFFGELPRSGRLFVMLTREDCRVLTAGIYNGESLSGSGDDATSIFTLGVNDVRGYIFAIDAIVLSWNTIYSYRL
jgi:hypothetical protein